MRIIPEYRFNQLYDYKDLIKEQEINVDTGSLTSNNLVNLDGIENLINLEYINFENNYNLVSIKGLEKCTKLKAVNYSNTPITI